MIIKLFTRIYIVILLK